MSVNLATPATKYAGNPIIPRASLASWYSNQLFDFQAMIDPANSSQILIFCSGLTVSTNVISIGLFTAPTSNPYNWTHVGQVLTGSGSGFDSAGVRLGSVIYDAGTFYMFYTGYATSYTANYFSGTIGVATSTDHLTFGSRTQIVTAAGNGRNDGSGLDCFAVIKKPDNSWAAVYAYYVDADPHELVGFRAATASTPTGTWTKAGSGDIYGGDASGTKFYEFHHLLYMAPNYYLVYEQGGHVSTNIPYQCYAAISSDPTLTFTALNGGTPLIPFGPAASWDQYHTATPGLLTLGNGNPTKVGGVYLGYYCGAGDVLEAYYSNEWPPAMVTFADLGSSSVSPSVSPSASLSPSSSPSPSVSPSSSPSASLSPSASPSASQSPSSSVSRSASSSVSPSPSPSSGGSPSSSVSSSVSASPSSSASASVSRSASSSASRSPSPSLAGPLATPDITVICGGAH